MSARPAAPFTQPPFRQPVRFPPASIGPRTAALTGPRLPFRTIRAPASALGAGGGGLGYSGITNSVALALNIYTGASGGIGYEITTNGTIGTNVAYPIAFSATGTAYTITVTYNAATSQVSGTITAAGGTPASLGTINNVNLATLLGSSTGYIGFTGGTGSVTSTQTISNFSLLSSTNYVNPVVLPDNASATVSVQPLFAGQLIGAGALTLGNSSSLNVNATAASPTNGAYNLLFGTTTLNGVGTLNVSNNGSGSGTVILGAINDGSPSGSLIKSGPGTLVITGASSYSGGTTITGGLLQVSGAGTLGNTNGSLTISNAGSMLDLNGTSQGVGNFSGDAGTIVVNNMSGTNVTFTIGNNNGSGVYNGVIADNTTGTGTVAVTMSGSGTITLNGINTYTGATTISGGTLVVNGSLAAGSTVSVNSGSHFGRHRHYQRQRECDGQRHHRLWGWWEHRWQLGCNGRQLERPGQRWRWCQRHKWDVQPRQRGQLDIPERTDCQRPRQLIRSGQFEHQRQHRLHE